MTEALVIGGASILPGERKTVAVPVARRYTQSEVSISATVVRGHKPGPTLLVCAAVHGDEINGIEIIARLLKRKALEKVRGTLIAVPIVNELAFLAHSRYSPDRRDLNRIFPGSPKGSLTSRLADTFVTELVKKATHVIDLHTASNNRENLPQIRACLDDPETDRLAREFGTPVIIDANTKDGSLRQTVLELGLPMLLYEAGEALRFDEIAINAGVRGVLSVMRAISMLAPPKAEHPKVIEPFIAASTRRLRAPESGMFHALTQLGARVDRGAVLGFVSDPLREREVEITSPYSGIVIGKNNLPLVNEGDMMFHIATFQRLSQAAESVEAFADQFIASDFGSWGG